MVGVIIYRVLDYKGEKVLDTNRSAEAYVRARQCSGHVELMCPDCGGRIDNLHSCFDV